MPITLDSPYGLDVSANDNNLEFNITVLDRSVPEAVESDVSSNDQIILSTVSDIKSLISDYIEDNKEVTPSLSLYAVGLSGRSNAPMNGYFVMYNNEFVYIPFDKVQYLTKKGDQVYNLSSQTISCYSFDSSGNTVNQFRINSFGTFQKYTFYQNQYNSWWQWDDVYITTQGSNITYGQTGINNFDSLCLFGILIFVGFLTCINAFKR